ncbi:MAG: hypothetical protein V4611_03825 [Patescibacteria group bacterium]
MPKPQKVSTAKEFLELLTPRDAIFVDARSDTDKRTMGDAADLTISDPPNVIRISAWLPPKRFRISHRKIYCDIIIDIQPEVDAEQLSNEEHAQLAFKRAITGARVRESLHTHGFSDVSLVAYRELPPNWSIRESILDRAKRLGLTPYEFQLV